MVATRITSEMKEIIQALVDEDDREIAWMVRKLLTEALEARGLLKNNKS